MKLETLKTLYERYQGGASYTDMAQAIGRTPSHAANLCAFFKSGTYDDVVDILVFQNYKRYSLDEYIDIAEQMVTQKIKLVAGVLRFRIEFNRLAALTRLRKNKGSVLSYADMRALSWAGKADVSNSTKAEKSKDDVANLPNVTETPHGTQILANDMTAEELDKVTDKPRKFGRAKVHPHAYRGKKVMRNKAVTEANKQQERIKQSIANAQAMLTTQNDGTTATTQEGGTTASATTQEGGTTTSAITSQEWGTTVSATTQEGGTTASATTSQEGGTTVSATTQEGSTTASATTSQEGGSTASATTQEGGTTVSATTQEGGTTASATTSQEGGTTVSATTQEGSTAASATTSQEGGTTAYATTTQEGSTAASATTTQEGGDDTTTTDNGELSVSEISHRSYNNPTLFTGHPASKFLDVNGNYTGGGRGRPPYIDVNSEGFDKLPLEVQIASFRRFRDDKNLELAFLKKAQALAMR